MALTLGLMKVQTHTKGCSNLSSRPKSQDSRSSNITNFKFQAYLNRHELNPWNIGERVSQTTKLLTFIQNDHRLSSLNLERLHIH
uniref:Uncharacterized protein n=1 Tax=Physcomitrium patens TaxID=3218 RepID=A0A2K1KVI9_PHYPA|nr:hypothetical protein PHYPA_004799 [Physcomitrium patens]